MTRGKFRVHGSSHPGLIREQNEDCFLSDAQLGFYAVFDGMGGHNAGDVASKLARRVVHEYVIDNQTKLEPKELLDAALQAASAEVHREARSRRDLHGMGTTVVACMVTGDDKAFVAHVGDSRAYLMRESRLRLLTRDHTVVSELLSRGAISAEDAMHHPYKSVLSRNLGGKPETRVDHAEVDLTPGDRLLLCSDGLTGFSSHEAVEQLLGGAEDPEVAVSDLLDLALRGGGGDNVTAMVIESERPQLAPNTQILRTSGAASWWNRRELFLQEARLRGVASSPICAVLSEEEAVSIVADNLCQALFHDLESSTGINVWTFAENLANGWFEQKGSYRAIRDLLDLLRACAEVVITDIYASEDAFAIHLEVAIMRALIVAELAVAGAIAEHTRRIEVELVRHSTVVTEAPAITEEKTIPFMSVRGDAPSPNVLACLDRALENARSELVRAAAKQTTLDCLAKAHFSAIDHSGESDMLNPARELYGSRMLVESGVSPLLEALDDARRFHLGAARAVESDEEVKAAAVRRIAAAHQGLFNAVAFLIADACQPITDGLKAAAEETASLRAQVGRGEAKIAELERKLSQEKRKTIRGMGQGDL